MALAKARDEKEAAKKAKITTSIEVNNPQVGSRAEEANLSLQSSNFRPRGSPGYTPRSPTPDQAVGDQTAEAVLVPFTELKRSKKNKRLNNATRIICTDRGTST